MLWIFVAIVFGIMSFFGWVDPAPPVGRAFEVVVPQPPAAPVAPHVSMPLPRDAANASVPIARRVQPEP